MLADSFLIESSSKLLVTMTGIKNLASSILGLWFPWPIYMFLKLDLTLGHWTQVSDLCPLGYLFLNDFDIFRKKQNYIAGIRLHTFWNILRNYVLEAIQTRTVSNFGAFYYIFIVNAGLYKEPEFAPTKIIRNLNKSMYSIWKTLKFVHTVCTEVLFVLDSKKTQVENVFPIKISVFSAAAVFGYR